MFTINFENPSWMGSKATRGCSSVDRLATVATTLVKIRGYGRCVRGPGVALDAVVGCAAIKSEERRDKNETRRKMTFPKQNSQPSLVLKIS